MTDFNMATADRHQLRFYAKETLGLQLHHSLGEQKMRDRIVQHCKDNELEAPKASLGLDRKGSETIKRVTINIAKQAIKGGAENAFVGVQGVGFSIPRGINISVPASVAEALKNAVQDIITQDPDTGELLKEPVLTYPFQIISSSEPAESAEAA